MIDIGYAVKHCLLNPRNHIMVILVVGNFERLETSCVVNIRHYTKDESNSRGAIMDSSRIIKIPFDKKEFISQLAAIQKNLTRYVWTKRRIYIICLTLATICIIVLITFKLNIGEPLFDQSKPDTMLKVVEYYNDSNADPRFVNKSERQFRLEYNLPKGTSSEWLVKLHSFRTAKIYFQNIFKVYGIRRACIESKAELRDIKGYYRRIKVLSLCMTRMSANKVHWDKITDKEMLKLYDFEYIFPPYDILEKSRRQKKGRI